MSSLPSGCSTSCKVSSLLPVRTLTGSRYAFWGERRVMGFAAVVLESFAERS